MNDILEVVPAKEVDDLIKAVKSLVSDIESMRRISFHGELTNWFGDFSEFDDNGESVRIEWPNLAISLAEVKKLLEPMTIEGELTKSQIVKQAAEAAGIPVIDLPLSRPGVALVLGLPKLKD